MQRQRFPARARRRVPRRVDRTRQAPLEYIRVGVGGNLGEVGALRRQCLTGDEAIQSCGGDMREAIKALIVMNDDLERSLAQVSYGCACGQIGHREAVG